MKRGLLGVLVVLAACQQPEPVVLQMTVFPTAIDLDPKDYRDVPAVGLFTLTNDNVFEVFYTPLRFEGEHADQLWTRRRVDVSLAAGANDVVEVSYTPDAQTWQDGSFTADLVMQVGFFDPTIDTGTGAAENRRDLYPSAWTAKEYRVTVGFTWDCDVDEDGQFADACGGDDCHDQNPTIGLGFPEICDSADNDCDGVLDEDPTNGTSWYYDGDLDGWGDDATVTASCRAPARSWVVNGGDCDDANDLVHPVGFEFCDGVDNDCDLDVDEACL